LESNKTIIKKKTQIYIFIEMFQFVGLIINNFKSIFRRDFMKVIKGNNRTLSESEINKLFLLTHEVMTALIPSTNTIKEGFDIWFKSFNEKRNNTTYLIFFDDEDLRGYIAYSIIDKDIIIEDLILSQKSQGDGRTIAIILNKFLDEVHGDYHLIRTYTNKVNIRMQKLLSKFGFEIDSTTDKGIRYYILKDIFMNNLNYYKIKRTKSGLTHRGSI